MKFLAILVAALALLGLAIPTYADDYTIVTVQLLHRHGARTAEPSYNKSLICTDKPCGYLTDTGIQMLINAGAALRSRYNDGTVTSTPMFPSEDYDLDVAYSRSTDVLRTLQSGEAFLRGFFPNMSTLFPAIHTQPEQDDYLLYTNYVPQFQFFYNYNKPLVRGCVDPTTDKNFPDWTYLIEIAKEVYSEGYCSTYETRSDCARKLFDIGAYKDSVGELDNYPLLKANLDKLGESARVLFGYQYRYNASDERCMRQGSAGQPFLQQIVRNFEDVIAGTSTYKLFHYSGHDNTLSRLAATLGDTTDEGVLPPFAQVLVFELVKNETDGTYHVRSLRGHPGQNPASNFAFGWETSWKMKCMNAWQEMYEATDNTCPFEDFRRYIDWSKPSDAKGYCYLDEEFSKLRDCPAGGINVGADYQTLSEPCKYYRKRCPEFSCSNGYVLNGVSLQCVKTVSVSDVTASPVDSTAAPTTSSPIVIPTVKSGMSDAAVAGVSIATMCAGAIIAAAVTAAICVCSRRNEPKYSPVS